MVFRRLLIILTLGVFVIACSGAQESYDPSSEQDPYKEGAIEEPAEPVRLPPPPPPQSGPDNTNTGSTDQGIEPSPVGEDPIVNDLLSELKVYPIAYETPDEGRIGEAFDVTLAIDATGDNSAVEGLPQTDIVIEAEARLSKYVEASLSGAAFDIKLTNAQRQRLSPVRESVWRWSVTPNQAGSHNLYLEINAIVGENESMLLESFSDTINVTVSAQKESIWGANNIRTYISIIGGIISIILGLIALRSHLHNREKDKPKKDKDDTES